MEIEVNQADRELFIATLNPCDSVAESVRKGTSFTWEVQQIARHRIAAEQRARIEGFNEGIEAAAKVADAQAQHCYQLDKPDGLAAAELIEDAIRALAKPMKGPTDEAGEAQ